MSQLQLDSLVTDLIFQTNAALDQATLIAGLGGEEVLATKGIADLDRDPRLEMELSPSMPFRRRGEKRIWMIDPEGVAPRQDPQTEPLVMTDLRPAKEELIRICGALPIRLGKLFLLGTFGDAVMVARTARDLRGMALVIWALDPQVDLDGKRRASQLSQKEFEGKVLAFEKRLDELDEGQILGALNGVSFERRGDLLIVDVLEADGTWDQRKSMLMEQQLQALDRFSMIPGAPSTAPIPNPGPYATVAAAPNGKPAAATAANGAPAAAAAPPTPPPAPVKEEPKGPPLAAQEIDGKVILVFPAERFDLDVAAALGKRDWDHVIRASDKLTGAMRDKLHRDGAGWVAPIEFLSEVFVEGKPLTKQAFERDAQIADGVKSLEVHFPRFGEVKLFEIAGKGRFVTSLADATHAARLVG